MIEGEGPWTALLMYCMVLQHLLAVDCFANSDDTLAATVKRYTLNYTLP
jgi:hypothetical protein